VTVSPTKGLYVQTDSSLIDSCLLLSGPRLFFQCAYPRRIGCAVTGEDQSTKQKSDVTWVQILNVDLQKILVRKLGALSYSKTEDKIVHELRTYLKLSNSTKHHLIENIVMYKASPNDTWDGHVPCAWAQALMQP
jgi:hypothetical protein